MKNPAHFIDRELRAVGRKDRAASEAKYLKSDLRFFGATLPEDPALSSAVAKKGALLHDDLVPLVETLWAKPVFEFRMAAAILLDLHVEQLDPVDLGMLERFIRDSKTWALVDPLSGKRGRQDESGPPAPWILRTDGRAATDFWVRRSSLLAELRPLKHGVFSPFAEPQIGCWKRRSSSSGRLLAGYCVKTSKKRPDEVYESIRLPRTQRASGVTMREVVKYLDPERGNRLMHAYKNGVPALLRDESATVVLTAWAPYASLSTGRCWRGLSRSRKADTYV